MRTTTKCCLFILLFFSTIVSLAHAQFVTERWETIHVGQTGVLRTYNDTLFFEDFEGEDFDCWESIAGSGLYGFSVTDELTLRNGAHAAYPYQGNYAAYEMDPSAGGLNFSQMISPNIHVADANNTVISFYVHLQATTFTNYIGNTPVSVTTYYDEAGLAIALDQSGTFYQPLLWNVNCEGCEADDEMVNINNWTRIESNIGEIGFASGNYNFDFLHVNEGGAGMGVDNILIYGPRQDTIPAEVSALSAGTYTRTETVIRKGCVPVTVTVHWTIVGDGEPDTPTPGPGTVSNANMPDNVMDIDCSFYPDGAAWTIVNEWSSDRSVKPVSNLVAPLVGDLDGDGTPEIVCFGATDQSTTLPYRVKELLVFDGATHAIKKVIFLPSYASSFTASPYGLVREGGKGLIVVAHDDCYLRAYDITAPDALVWKSDEKYCNSGDQYTTVAFGDLDNDGHAEVVVRNKVFDVATGRLLATATGGSNTGSSYAHTGNSSSSFRKKIAMACLANIDPSDDLVEVILGNEIYKPVLTAGRISGLSLWKTGPSLPTGVREGDGHAQVADFNLDGHLDVFISDRYCSSSTNMSNGTVTFYVWDVHNNSVSNAVALTTSTPGKSIPLIANIDHDDNLEIVIQCKSTNTSLQGMLAYKYDYTTSSFNHIWTQGVNEDSYSNGVTCFDFDQDGDMELLVCDQVKMQIVDGNGTVKSTLSYFETTIMQYPIIADVDNDGHAEIVSVGYSSASTFNGSLNIFRSADAPWPPARPVWNQYLYNVTNVNKDLTVPRYLFNNAQTFTDNLDGAVRRPFNNFLQQATTIDLNGRPFYGVADVADVSATASEGVSIHIYVSFMNNGAQSLTAPYSVTYYKETYGGEILSTFQMEDRDVAVGATEYVNSWFLKDYFCGLNLNNIVVAVNDAGTGVAQLGGQQEECHTDNNTYVLNVANMCENVPVIETTYVDQTACDRYEWYGTSYTTSSTYYHTVDDTHVEALRLTINPSSTPVTVTERACDRYDWTVGERTISFTSTTSYDTVLQNSKGCDSLMTLNVTVNHSSVADPVSVTYCTPYVWPFNGATYASSGSHTQTISGGNAFGCDTTATLNITISSNISVTMDVTACDSYVWNNNNTTYSSSGVYTGGTVPSVDGCDSTTTLNLTINHSSTPYDTNVVACDVFEWFVGNTDKAFSESALSDTIIRNTVGCDSTVTLHLTINHSTVADPVEVQACGEYTWAANGETYSASVTENYTGRNAAGCDSLMTLLLTINNSIVVDVNATACDSYTWDANNVTYTVGGDYSVSGTTAAGCDSTTTLHLTIRNSSTPTTITEHACEQYVWTVGGSTKTFVASASFDTLLVNREGCDSLVTLNLTMDYNTVADAVEVQACGEYTWVANGETYSASVIESYTGRNAAGCDSLMTLQLTVNNAVAVDVNATACDSYTWDANNVTYTVGGDYSVSGTTAAGCDSTTTLHLTIRNSSTPTTITEHACEQYVWAVGGSTKTFVASASFDTLLVNREGCDSLVTLNLTVDYNTVADPVEVQTCGEYTWAANGETYSASVTESYTGRNAAGCDSLMTLQLTVNNAVAVDVNATACDSYTWDANNVTYTVGGDYSVSGTTAAGCDSTTTLHLVVNNSVATPIVASACDSFTWTDIAGNAVVFDSSTLRDVSYRTVHDCDSTIHLDITIRYSTTAAPVNVSYCEPYTWSFNNVTYAATSNVTETIAGGNSVGCDTTATLDLTISSDISITVNQFACDEFRWDNNGQTYSVSGIYTGLTLPSVSGCDSTTILNLTVKYNSSPVLVAPDVCDSYDWTLGGNTRTFTESVRIDTVIGNAAGCDSLVTLNLTVRHSTSADEAVSSCGDYVWSIDGQTYSESGIHNATVPNAVGCDSVVTLSLIVNDNSETTYDTVLTCVPYTWRITSQRYDVSGIYSDTLSNSVGCDSVKVLVLTVAETPMLSLSPDTVINMCGRATVVALGGDSYNVMPSASVKGMSTVGDSTLIVLTPNSNTSYTVTAYSAVRPYGTTDDALIQYLCPVVNMVHVGVTIDTSDIIVCDAYTWPDNNLTYTQSGYYSCNTTTAEGCDSLRVLHIEVGNSYVDTVFQQACKRYYWNVDHVMYNVSGMYNYSVQHETGCDTTHYLRLIVDDCSDIAIPDNINDPSCIAPPEATTLNMRELFSCDGVNGLTTPLVGDVDGDGKAEILACAADTAASTGSSILVFDGQDGTLKYTLNVQRYSTAGQLMSLADINGDGTAEFFLLADDGYAYCYNATTGAQLWRSSVRIDARYLPMIADLNADNHPELVCGPYIFNAANGLILLHGTQEASGRGYGAPHTEVGEGRSYYMQALADIDRDGEQEICAGNTIYKPILANPNGEEGNTWQVLRTADTHDDIVGYDGQTFIADFDHDGDMDICVVGFRETNKADLYVWDGQTSLLVGYYNVSMSNSYGGNMTPSIPFCGDLDGDGTPEILFNHPDGMRAFSYSATAPNHISLMHFASQFGETAGFTVFDFNRDGTSEIVYRGTEQLSILDGASLTSLSTPVTSYSGTLTEYPVVADVNGDGHAEIIVAHTNLSWDNGDPRGKITVYGSMDNNWNSARSVWNQWVYNSVCINEDLTVPRHQYDIASVYSNGTEPFNGFLRQMPLLDQNGDIYVSIPDIDASAGRISINYSNAGAVVNVRYCNNGEAILEAPYGVCLYEDAYRGRVIGTYTVSSSLAVGSCETQAFNIPMMQLCHINCDSIAAAINDSGMGIAQHGGQQTECDTTNNVVKVRFTPVKPKSDTLRIASCDRYRWPVTGDTYTIGLTVADTMQNSIGCDSINVLKLTIYKAYHDTIDTAACDMFIWRANNVRFMQSAEYTQAGTTTHGCDSIKHLRVSIYHGFDTTEYVEACNSYRWPVDNRMYTRSTTHTEVMSTRYGCDSVHTLVVNVYYTSSDTTYDTICYGSYRVFGGMSYRQSGHYTYAVPMTHACDSIHELFLTVKPKLDVKLKWTSQCELQQYTLAALRVSDDSNTVLRWTAYPTDIELAMQQDSDTVYVQPTLATVYTATLSYLDDYACPVSATLSLKPTKPVEAAIDISTTRLTPDITSFRATAKGSGYEYHSWFIDHNYYSEMNSIEYNFDPLAGVDSVVVSLIVSSGNCIDRDSVVLHYSTANLNVPNVIIPTDPNNCTFHVKGHGVMEYEIHIYNRQGLLVFHSNDINEPWDAKLKDGTLAHQGTYVYNIRYRLATAPDELKRTTGTVTVIR